MAYLESQYSEQVFAMANDTIAPGQVTGLAYTVEQGKVNLTWDALITNVDESSLEDLASYHVYRKETADGEFVEIGVVGSTETTYVDTTMKDGATYFYAVSAKDDAETPNEGALSEQIEAKTIPSIPTGLSATAEESHILLEWTSVQDQSDAKLNENLAGYNIYRSVTDGEGYELIDSVGVEAVSYQDSNVTSEHTYYYVITSYDDSL